MKHTPGPWFYLPKECKIVTCYPDPTWLTYEDKDKDLNEIPPITIINTYGAMGGDDTQADATLMAAAPELLEALTELFEHCCMIHKHWGDDNNQKEADAAINKAHAAIAKAKGETT
jgi:hypothetical protein